MLRAPYAGRERDRAAQGVADHHGPVELLEQSDRVVDHHVTGMRLELLRREPGRPAVPTLVDRDDREALAPVPDRLRPAETGVGEAVQEQHRRRALAEGAAEPVDDEVGLQVAHARTVPAQPTANHPVGPTSTPSRGTYWSK